MATDTVIKTASENPLTMPGDYDSAQPVQIKMWGAGGAGGSDATVQTGGGGGAYLQKNSYLLGAASGWQLQVGESSTQIIDIATSLIYFNATAGAGGGDDGPGGNPDSSESLDISFAGGNGGVAGTTGGGGGGGAAGPSGAGLTGSNGVVTAGGAGGAGNDGNGGQGGAGGNPGTAGDTDATGGGGGGGGNATQVGGAGGAVGGGGGGGGSSANGGAAGAGKVDITYTILEAPSGPTVQATNVNVTTLSADNIGFGWTSGNGAKRAVFVKAASSGTAAPVDDATYTANTTLGAGTQIGSSGWYCVYNGIGNEASVSGLTPEVTYRIHVCEYNGDPAAEKYNDDAAANNPINQQAVTIPPIAQATTVSATAVTAVSATVSWARGGGDKVVVFGKAASSGNLSGAVTDYQTYTANTALGSGTQIGSTGWFAVYNGTGTSTSVTNLLSGTNYVFAAIEYNGTAGDENYLDDTDTGNPGGFTTLSPSVMMSRSHRRSRTQRRRIGGK